MSKLGKRSIQIPKDTTVKVENGKLIFTGPKGSKQLNINDKIFTTSISKENNLVLKLIKKNEELNSIWGTTRSIVNSAIKGVSVGHEKILVSRRKKTAEHHSSEKRGLCLMKSSSETLQYLPYIFI